jgi:hypothetical protein
MNICFFNDSNRESEVFEREMTVKCVSLNVVNEE